MLDCIIMEFLNRTAEIARLDALIRHGAGLGVVYGVTGEVVRRLFAAEGPAADGVIRAEDLLGG